MSILIILIFIIGYIAIAFEHPLRINKAAPAIITGVLCWLIYFIYSGSEHDANEALIHHVGEIASILFFLLGAMTIVELIDAHNGFSIITEKIKTNSIPKLLLLVSILTFFLSAILDNLTTAIVMTSLCSKLLSKKEDRLWFSGMVIIAANSGGAWSPIGDVTTTMLWIGGQITTIDIILNTFIPSLVVCLIPMLLLMYKFKGKTVEIGTDNTDKVLDVHSEKADVVLAAGLILLMAVPVIKTVTHLPPFMGMLFALGIMWVITTVIHFNKQPNHKIKYSVSHALQRIDTPSILFFLGILLAVAALQSFGSLTIAATFLETHLKNDYLIGTALGVLSAIIDNVPLVAAAQGMYQIDEFPVNHPFWQFLALTSGTGGSMIIIGSAAGVAVMGIEQIDFMWYLKKISWLAAAGYFAGIFSFILQQYLMKLYL
ncbi:MAG: sodium:proton antiporter NhaD [Sphingobacteriales bacterium]|jgi:Na+/H+ antiporter NhaD/arsenite permease-like protein|nr:sodium:proton antiporter NhaD [Sphingobacteriales bacterium]